MFGNAPKALWSQWMEVAENNSIRIAMATIHGQNMLDMEEIMRLITEKE